MEKTVVVIKQGEYQEIKTGDKTLRKVELHVTDGYDAFTCEALGDLATTLKESSVDGKLCNITCKMKLQGGKEGRYFNGITCNSVTPLLEMMYEKK